MRNMNTKEKTGMVATFGSIIALLTIAVLCSAFCLTGLIMGVILISLAVIGTWGTWVLENSPSFNAWYNKKTAWWDELGVKMMNAIEKL